MANQTKKESGGIKKLKASVLAYMKYFIEYTGIFDLFYLAKVGNFGNKQSTIDLISKSLNNVCEKEWNYCMSHKLFSIEKVESIKSQLKYVVIGLLLLYLNRRTPDSYSEFIDLANNQIDNLLEIKKKKGSKTTLNSGKSKVQNSIISVNVDK